MGKKYFIVTFNGAPLFDAEELVVRAYSEEDVRAYFKAEGLQNDDLAICEASAMELTDGVLHEEEEA